ncbi:hypothetical protein SMA5143A_2928 [Streptomyces sp. MA5143a]|nr:hypothetical protein SMA5143A_2928 [Streptomyces sp. MA5143a]
MPLRLGMLMSEQGQASPGAPTGAGTGTGNRR